MIQILENSPCRPQNINFRLIGGHDFAILSHDFPLLS